TRWPRDWSSDVCSSDLAFWSSFVLVSLQLLGLSSSRLAQTAKIASTASTLVTHTSARTAYRRRREIGRSRRAVDAAGGAASLSRSEERRGGKEGRWRRS